MELNHIDCNSDSEGSYIQDIDETTTNSRINPRLRKFKFRHRLRRWWHQRSGIGNTNSSDEDNQSNVSTEFDEYLNDGQYELSSETYLSDDKDRVKIKEDKYQKDLQWDKNIRKKLIEKKIDPHDVWNALRTSETVKEIQEINWHYLLDISDENLRILIYNIQFILLVNDI